MSATVQKKQSYKSFKISLEKNRRLQNSTSEYLTSTTKKIQTLQQQIYNLAEASKKKEQPQKKNRSEL